MALIELAKKYKVKSYIDTDGRLDRCSECGDFARFLILNPNWSVECTGCANTINPQKDRLTAMLTWNIEQRTNKESK
jgi:hypothetical protein